MSIFRRGPNRMERLLAAARLQEAVGRIEPAIPPGTRIFTSWSPKVAVAHVKSAVNAGSVCDAMSQREGPWLGTGSDEERRRAAALRLCPRCAAGDYGEGRVA